MNSILLVTLVLAMIASTISKDCTSPPAQGTCKALEVKFYFDSKTKTCKTFNWGGCLVVGNGNRYATKEKCERACLDDDCSSEPAAGTCRGAYKRYYYDTKTKACKSFTFGGCPVDGNRNNFESPIQCSKTCLRHVSV